MLENQLALHGVPGSDPFWVAETVGYEVCENPTC